jgi:hypothetical protein
MGVGRHWKRIVAGTAVCLVGGCTTYVQPVTCEEGATNCNQDRDVKFCEYEAIEVAGTNCGDLGLAPGKRFCILDPIIGSYPCMSSTYQAKNCSVTLSRQLWDGRECSTGAPVFARR